MKKGYVVPIREKLAYGIGDLAINIAYGSIGFYMLWFIVNIGGVSPALAGTIFMLARFWDAITDYFMGRISDNTKSKYGRRRPYIFFGAIPMAISFAALWFVPNGSEIFRFGYYLLVLILFNTAFTIVAVPYGSLMAELTQNYDERTTLSTFRVGSSFVGTLIGAAGIPLVTDVLFGSYDKQTSFIYMGVIFAILIAFILFITALGTKERVEIQTNTNYEGFFTTIISFFKLKEFRYTVFIFLFNMIGIDIIMAVFIFFIADVVQIEGDATIYMAIPMITALVAAPFWNFIANKIGKVKAYVTSAVYFTLVMTVCLVLPQNNVIFTIVICILSGIGISAGQILPWSMLPDVIEIDEYNNGIRREGAFFGIVTFMYKLASAIAIAAVGSVMQIFGYIETSPDEVIAASQQIIQPASALFSIRVLMGILPGMFFIISIVLAWKLPITKEKFNDILNILEQRKINREA